MYWTGRQPRKQDAAPGWFDGRGSGSGDTELRGQMTRHDMHPHVMRRGVGGSHRVQRAFALPLCLGGASLTHAVHVTHLNTQTNTATGAGATGTPTIRSFNIPRPDAANNAVITDPVGAGLTCTTSTCTATGGATCSVQRCRTGGPAAGRDRARARIARRRQRCARPDLQRAVGRYRMRVSSTFGAFPDLRLDRRSRGTECPYNRCAGCPT